MTDDKTMKREFPAWIMSDRFKICENAEPSKNQDLEKL
jgi:hypothetical protein